MITIWVTDQDLVTVGNPIVNYTQFSANLKLNRPSGGHFTVPASPAAIDQMQAGNRIEAIDDDTGQVIISGPIVQPQGPYFRSLDDDSGAGSGELTVTFVDDSALFVSELVYPDPTLNADSQTIDEYVSTANAEVVMRDLVNRNAGPGALVSRRIPHLVLGDLAGAGSMITFRSQWGSLGDELRAAALAGGDLGWSAVRVDNTIEFRVAEPDDVSAQVRFGWDYGNLRDLTYTSERPAATVVIVGGAGTGAARTIREVTDSAAVARWGRIERWISGPNTTDTAELDQAGAAALLENGERVTLQAKALDVPTQRYGIHYGLNSIVSVDIEDGLSVADVVREVGVESSPQTGVTYRPVIGTPEAMTSPPWVRVGRALSARLARLERT